MSSTSVPEALASPGNEREPAYFSPGADSRLPRKVVQQQDFSQKFASSFASATQNGSSGSAFAAGDQESTAQSTQHSKSSQSGAKTNDISSSPETIHYDLQPDATDTVNSRVEQTDYTVTYVTTTTTEVGEQTSEDILMSGQSATARDIAALPRKSVTTSSPRTSTGPGERPSLRAGIHKKASFYKETRSTPAPENGRARTFSSASATFETYEALPRPAYNSAVAKLVQMERLYREEKDCILDVATTDVKDCTRYYEDQLADLRTHNTKLIHDVSDATSRTTQLQIQLDALRITYPGSEEQLEVDPAITTHLTTITTITTTITTVITRIKDLSKHPSAKGQVSISMKELEYFLSQLSATSAQTTEIQQHYAKLSGDFSSIHRQLQVTSSQSAEKDRNLASLTAEVAQWQKTDALKTQEMADLRRENESFKNELSIASSRANELQLRLDSRTKELGSARSELQSRTSVVEEKDRTIASLTAKVNQWEQSDAAKVVQITNVQRDNERLQSDLSALSSRTAEIQKRYDAQLKDILVIRNELQSKVSLLEEKEHIVISLSDELARAKLRDGVQAEQVETVRKEVEKLRLELSSATSRTAELQKRYEAQSQELNYVRDQLHQIEILYQTDQPAGNPSKEAISKQIRVALQKKSELLEKLRVELVEATSRNAELQKSYEAVSKDASVIRGELKVKTLEYEGTVSTLTIEVNRWKSADSAKADQIATTSKRVEKLQHDLTSLTSELTELRGRYEAQSGDLVAVRNELQAKISSEEGSLRSVASLTAEVEQWKTVGKTKSEQLATTIKQVEKLQHDFSTSTSQLAELRSHYEATSHELTTVRTELHTSTLSIESKDRTIASLTAEVEQWKGAGANKSEQMAITLKQVEKLQQDLSESTSQLADLQRRFTVQSNEIIVVRKEVETWKHTAASKSEELVTVNKNLEEVRIKLDTSTLQIQKLENLRTGEAGEFATARKDLEELRRDLFSAKSQVEHWKASDTTKGEKLTDARKEVEELQQELSKSSSQVVETEQRYQQQSTELSTLRENLKITFSLVRVMDVTTLNVRIEQLLRDGTAKEDELAHAKADVDQLQRKLSVSTSQIANLKKDYEKRIETLEQNATTVSQESLTVHDTMIKVGVKGYTDIVQLTTMVDEWLHTDAKRAEELTRELERRNKENEELRRNLILLKEIYVHAPQLEQIFRSQTTEIQRRYEQQSKELKSQLDGVQRFVTTADTYADTMIIQMLQKLNAEVQQNTTFMAECILEDFQRRGTKLSEERVSAMQRVAETIGQPLAGCLGKLERDDVALYLPIAFQAFFTYHLCGIISSWTIEKGYNDLINEIYRRLQKKEAQTISGRWRSLTRTYILPTCMSDPSAIISSTVAGLSDIVVVAGCAPSSSAANSKVFAEFEDKVTSMILIAGQFSKMIGEVVSGDFEVMAIRPDKVFDESTMEEDVDDYDEKGGAANEKAVGQKVVCSTHLGLMKQMPLESGEKDTLTVMKSRVLLESFLTA